MRIVLLATVVIPVAGGLSPTQAASRQEYARHLGRLVGTDAVRVDPIEVDGQLRACALGFLVVLRDRGARGERFTRVLGSIGFIASEQDGRSMVAPYLKLVVHEIDLTTLSLTPRPPVYGSFAAAGASNSDSVVKQFEPLDTPGSVFVVFALNPSSAIFSDALASRKITLAFLPSKGEPEVKVEVDLRVVETRDDGARRYSTKPVEDMQRCLVALQEFKLPQ